MLNQVVASRAGGGDVKTEVLKTLNWIKEKLSSSTGLSAYPVGSIYISVNAESPTELFGGAWEPLEQGRVLIGQGSNYPAGSTGGEATHVLSLNEMPSHNHGGTFSGSGSTNSVNISGSFGYFRGDSNSTSMGTGVFSKGSIKSEAGYTGGSWVNGRAINMNSNHSHTFSVSGNINSQGSNAAHNNMQPYLAVYMWKRTA